MAAPQKLGVLDPQGKRGDGALMVRQVVLALNKVYEGTLTAGVSPLVLSFNTDYGYNAIKGWIINDGKGAFTVEFTRDGTTWGEAWTMRPGERTDLDALDVHSLRLTWLVLDSDYRIWQA